MIQSSVSTAEEEHGNENSDENELKWAAIERLPTFRRVRMSLFDEEQEGSNSKKTILDVTKLGVPERHVFVDRLIKHVEDDNLRLLWKQKERLDRVNMKQPTIEVRYMNLHVEAKCRVVQGKPLPTLWNTAKSMISDFVRVPGLQRQEAKICILEDVSGIIKPSRMTLLLGPPGCGKTTLLKALAGKLDTSLEVSGDVLYNGFRLDEFIPEKTAVYVSQYDLHIPEMTVRETLDFSARLQGVHSKAEMMKEVIRREKNAGITPDPDVDTYMKATSVEGLETSLQTDYIMKIMGLDKCADTRIGDALRRGISGGEKKRVTTGEMIVGPSKALFMDEISTGLDSSTTFQIVSCLQQFAHISESTVMVSLLQPAPETYNLFDDVVLMAEGRIVYHGPRTGILNFFKDCGFKCPERKGEADFLQEVLSKKDQKQYWNRPNEHYNYVTTKQFSEKFKAYHVGQNLADGLSNPLDKSKCHNALSFDKYSLSKVEIVKACLARELLLMKRNVSIYAFKGVQLGVLAVITGTVFFRTQMHIDMLHANDYLGSLFYGLFLVVMNAVPEVQMVIARLPVLYRQRDLYFYPAWAYTIPAVILKIPVSLIESIIWTSITYYLIGYSSEATRFFKQLLVFFFVHSMALSEFRLVAAYFQTSVLVMLAGPTFLMLFLLFGGFLIPKASIPNWLKWGFWTSPLSYTEIALATNEFSASRWQKVLLSNTTIGRVVLMSHGLDYDKYYYWISIFALFGFIVLFNMGFALALALRKPPGVTCTIISHEKLAQLQGKYTDKKVGLSTRNEKMVLPFIPLAISFRDLNYFVDTPPEMRRKGRTEKRLQLLHNITGSFRPGVLSALMGVTGSGKTTLLDVLSGRKTTGVIEGDVRIGGYPKRQETFARISGYCEQMDIHSPQITVEESVIFSAWLRLPSEISSKTRYEFVNEALEMVELDGIRDALVGLPGADGLSTEQRKRLTVAVELVSNPSLIFMDEPTSGLDARAAAIVIRAVKNIARTGRTVVCTIHQPSIDIFEAFDELMLMKRGGQLIYSGPIGYHSSKVIEYFQAISGVPRIKTNYNTATWMFEVTSTSVELQLGIDFAQIYKTSHLYEDNIVHVDNLSKSPPNSKDISFPTRFSLNGWEQFKACLWKQNLTYWRSPSYNLLRISFMLLTSLLYAALYWKQGGKIRNQQDLLNILGCSYIIVLFSGMRNTLSVIPYVNVERIVICREIFAGMYSPWVFSAAQVAIEIPYVLIQVIVFMCIAYPAIGYSWTAYKFFWFFYITFCTFLYFTYVGMMLVSLTPNVQVASTLASVFFALQNLFSGYIVPISRIPKWWIWFYYISPMSWTLDGLITSQYGDMHEEIMVFGESKSIAAFLEDYFGFRHDWLAVVAVVLFAFPVAYAFLFAFCTAKLNFQRR